MDAVNPEEWRCVQVKKDRKVSQQRKEKKLGKNPCGKGKQQTTQYISEHKSWSPVGSDEAWLLAHIGPE